MITKESHKLHSNFSQILPKCPSLIRWAHDKIQSHFQDNKLLECSEDEYKGKWQISRWYFEGKFSRKPKEFHKYWKINNDIHLETGIIVKPGKYRGQKDYVMVAFTRYERIEH